MVTEVPRVNVSSKYLYSDAVPAADQVFGLVVECNKGTPNHPTYVRNPTELYDYFGVEMDAYWGVGGQPLWVTRAVSGTPTKAVHYLVDSETSPVPVIKLEAKYEGSYDVYITAGPNAQAGNDIVLQEENCMSEAYTGVIDSYTVPAKSSIERLVERINEESFLATAYFNVLEADKITTRWDTTYDSKTESIITGNDKLALTGEVVLGSGVGNTAGTDGETKDIASQKIFDLIPDDKAALAHRTALAGLESKRIAGVFTAKASDSVYAEYSAHVAKMNTPQEHGLRFAILGAEDDSTMSGMITTAVSFNSESIIYVGQGVVDINGTKYTPRLATQVVAGKIGYTSYQYAIWGGATSKLLAANDINYITDIMTLPGSLDDGTAGTSDIIVYNEHGVLTFLELDDGIRVREGVTTAQDSNTTAEDEIAVVRIIRHAKYQVYDACYALLGENIGNTFDQDMQTAAQGVLKTMKDEGALVDVAEDGLSAYSVSVSTGSRSNQRQGLVAVAMSITPVHAARTIDVSISIY